MTRPHFVPAAGGTDDPSRHSTASYANRTVCVCPQWAGLVWPHHPHGGMEGAAPSWAAPSSIIGLQREKPLK